MTMPTSKDQAPPPQQLTPTQAAEEAREEDANNESDDENFSAYRYGVHYEWRRRGEISLAVGLKKTSRCVHSIFRMMHPKEKKRWGIQEAFEYMLQK